MTPDREEGSNKKISLTTTKRSDLIPTRQGLMKKPLFFPVSRLLFSLSFSLDFVEVFPGIRFLGWSGRIFVHLGLRIAGVVGWAGSSIIPLTPTSTGEI